MYDIIECGYTIGQTIKIRMAWGFVPYKTQN